MTISLRKIAAVGVMIATAILPFMGATPAFAAVPNWNTTGSYTMDFDYGGSHYVHDLSLSQAGASLSGNGGYPAGGPHTYTWVLTSGSVDGDTIDFYADYTASADAVTPLTTMHVIGTIAGDGSMSGTWSDNYQGGNRTGTWATASGHAVAISQAVTCPANTTSTLIETVVVPSTSAVPTMSAASLVNGDTYVLKASGTWVNTPYNLSDAEFTSIDSWATHNDGYDIAPYLLGEGEFDLQVNNAFVNWGPYSTTHEYFTTLTGNGSSASFLIFDGNSNTPAIEQGWYGDNVGSLSVAIYHCIPEVVPPPFVAACPEGTTRAETPMETVTVPAGQSTDTISTNVLANGMSYILRASGVADAGDSIVFDAKYSFRTPTSVSWTDAVSTYESYGTTLLDLLVNGTTPWGAYQTSHAYEALVTGNGAQAHLLINDAYYPNNTGSISVDVIQCVPDVPPTGSLKITKTTLGGDGTFAFTGVGESFNITTTDGTGSITLNDLTPGSYTISETTQSGWTQTSNTCSAIEVVAGQTATCAVANTKLGSISGMKYNDLNRNGKKDANEPGLQGWTIKLKRPNGTVIASTVTAADGTYSFTNLVAGTYKVREVHQNGWKRMSKNPKPIVISAGSQATGVDFGNAKKQKHEREDNDGDDNHDDEQGSYYCGPGRNDYGKTKDDIKHKIGHGWNR